MKRFRVNSVIFVSVIAVIFGCNVFYLSALYRSIRQTVVRDVNSALADADLDELWIRAEKAQNETKSRIASGQQPPGSERHGETSVGQDSAGNMVSTTRHPDGKVSTEAVKMQNDDLHNKLVHAVGKQFHAVLDPYISVNLSVMDSVVACRLNNRHIYPGYVATETIDSEGKVIKANPRHKPGSYDVFTYSFNPDAGLSYRVYMTPLTQHILSEMAGVIVTVFLLMAAFASAFWYLFHTVSRLRTIEEMKDDFVSNMTHELKTPIAIAYSANDALLNYDSANDPAKKEQYLRIANRQLKRLSELVENILAMSMERRKSIRMRTERIELRPFVEEIASAQRMQSEKEIAIETCIPDGLAAEADRGHLSNVLHNLLDNAVKYSGDSVRISIKAGPEGISVADDGIGIPAKALPYIFDKFYRVPHGDRQDVRGYGIGLFYVRSILEKMGWSVSVRSKEGEGSVFTIRYRKDE